MKNANGEDFHFSPRKNRAHEIKWIAWGSEAFERSEQENKPILLSLSAVWCHWCHVMDETTYSDGQVIQTINQKFIPVRVDSDRRPDLNGRYNQGGWPTTAMLTNDGEIIAGTTYIPPDQLCRLLNDVYDLYTDHAAEIEAAVEQVRQRRLEQQVPQGGGLDASIVDFVVDVAERAFDAEHGGFGDEPKFPYPGLLKLLLSQLAADAPGNLGEITRLTLENMSHGGIYDQVEGGFFRYSTDKSWSVPHYEKLLQDNASLLQVYAEAYNLSGDADYARTVYGIYKYLNSVLLDSATGIFFGSQDADEEYYCLDSEKRKKRSSPLVDRTLFNAPNCTAASALLRGFQVLGDDEIRDRAVIVLKFIQDRMWDDCAGAFHFYDGDRRMPGMLADNVAFATACLDAYESGAGEIWLDRSLRAANWILQNLSEPSGVMRDSAVPPADSGYPKESLTPMVENAHAADLFIRLFQSTGQAKFDRAAKKMLKYFAAVFQDYGLISADYALAVARLLAPPARISITGPAGELLTIEMILAAHRSRIPFRSVEMIDPEKYAEDLEETGYGYDGAPTAYISIGATCQPRVIDPVELPARIENAWSAINEHWGRTENP